MVIMMNRTIMMMTMAIAIAVLMMMITMHIMKIMMVSATLRALQRISVQETRNVDSAQVA